MNFCLVLPDTEQNSTSTIKWASENWACLCFWNPYLGCSPWINQAQVSDPFKHSLCLLKSSPLCPPFVLHSHKCTTFLSSGEKDSTDSPHFQGLLDRRWLLWQLPLDGKFSVLQRQPAKRLVTQCTEMTRKFMKTYQRGCSRDEGNNKNARLGGTAERRPVSLKRRNLASSEKLKSGLCILAAPWWIRTFDF